MRKIFLSALLLLFGSTILFAQNTEQTQVMMKMLGLKNALIAKDSMALSKLLADDVTYGHTSGIIQTKQELIHDITTSVQDYKSIEPSNMNIRVYDNSAIVTMNSHVNLLYKNNPVDMNMFVTLVWIKENGDWKLEARESVKQ